MGAQHFSYLKSPDTSQSSKVNFPKLAPAGTFTVKLFELAAVTVAFVAPRKTILLFIIVLKPVPVIVTIVPAAPLEGVNELIIGCAVILIKPSNKIYNNRYFKTAGILYLKLSIINNTLFSSNLACFLWRY